jgi:hypothetical protein
VTFEADAPFRLTTPLATTELEVKSLVLPVLLVVLNERSNELDDLVLLASR